MIAIDPRFQEIDDHLAAAILAQVEGNEQAIIEHNYYIRELAWSINSDILLGRWAARPRHNVVRSPRSNAQPQATLDDLLI